jgi:hypothetical protein
MAHNNSQKGFIFINVKSLWLILFLLPNILQSQIQIDKAGDGWDLKIDSALCIVKQYDSTKYKLLTSVCSKVEFWSNSFSSNDGVKTILVSVGDVKLNSINNLAVVLVHESLHLYLMGRKNGLSEKAEENYCYRYELEFLKMLPNPEPWLIDHALKNIQATQ